MGLSCSVIDLTYLCIYIANKVNFLFHVAEMSSWLTLSLSLFHESHMWSLTLNRITCQNDQVSISSATLYYYFSNSNNTSKSDKNCQIHVQRYLQNTLICR